MAAMLLLIILSVLMVRLTKKCIDKTEEKNGKEIFVFTNWKYRSY